MKTEDIKKMAQAWKEVQEASYGKKKMEASDTQMGTITVKTDAEREARAKAYRDKKKAETNEAMDPVNPKELKGKHKDRKDKDINNDGKVDSTDKYLHARRKAVSAAIKGKKKDQEVEVQTSESTDQLGEGIFGKTPKINIGKLHDLHAYHEKKAEAHAAAQKKHDSNSKMADHHSEQGYEHENAAGHLHNASKAYDKGDHKAVAKHLDMYHKTPVARKGIKEEAEQIDEISNKTLTNYAKASYNDVLKRRANRPAGQGDESDPKIGKRLAMNKLAHKKGAFKEDFDLSDFTLDELEDFMMSEEFTQLDELSKKTLASYIATASDDRAKNALEIGKTGKINTKGLKRRQGINRAATKLAKEAKDHGNMNNGSPAGEGLSPSAKKELARKTPMPDIVNEPVIDKKTFDAIRASGKKAPMRNNDNPQGDKTPPKGK